MVKLEKIHGELFPNLYQSFLHDDDPLSSEQDWRNVFDYPWQTEHGHCGYALLDGSDVVGMIGMVFSERSIDQQLHKFCNLHTWWVREDHRGRSLALLRPILKLENTTITHFTPCDIVRAVTAKMGFKPLSSQLTILLPHRPRKQHHGSLEIFFDPDEIVGLLDEPNQRLLKDHLPYRCGHCLIRSGEESCYVFYTHVVRHRFPYCHIHYLSNPQVFYRHQGIVRQEIMRQHPVRFLACDRRLLGSIRLPRSFHFWSPSHAMFKSDQLHPHQIDHLYSDVVMLRLTVMPDLSHELRQIGRRALHLDREP